MLGAIVDGSSGMIDGQHGEPTRALHRTVQSRDADLGLEHELRREVPERHQHVWLDQSYLLAQEGSARFDLDGLWIAVSWRPALHDVRDVDLLARQTGVREQLVQQLSGGTDKGLALQILVLSRTFSDEHHPGGGVPRSEDDLRAREPERATMTIAHMPTQLFEVVTAETGHRAPSDLDPGRDFFDRATSRAAGRLRRVAHRKDGDRLDRRLDAERLAHGICVERTDPAGGKSSIDCRE